MGKKVEKEKNEIVEEFFRRNDPKNIKSMNDMYTAWKDFFAPAFQQSIPSIVAGTVAVAVTLDDEDKSLLSLDDELDEYRQTPFVCKCAGCPPQ